MSREVVLKENEDRGPIPSQENEANPGSTQADRRMKWKKVARSIGSAYSISTIRSMGKRRENLSVVV